MGNKVIVAMSGGVDSSVTAAMLVGDGYEVIGVTLLLHEHCQQAIKDAEFISQCLGIKHYIIDARKEFKQKITDVFIEYYAIGLTPNPCAFCNRDIKTKILIDFADKNNINILATGHYANIEQIEDGSYQLKESLDKSRDQSYFLSLVPQDKFSRIIMPLGMITKKEVREYARTKGLEVAEKKDSQDICFIPNNDYAKFLEKSRLVSEKTREKLFSPGKIMFNNQNVGQHNGIAMYTVGQRRGLGVSHTTPLYVTEIDTKNNQIIVAEKEKLIKNIISIKDVNWIVQKPDAFDCEVKLRSGNLKIKANIKKMENNFASVMITDDLTKLLKTPVSKGQICVMYDQDVVIGGGIIF